MQGDSRGVAELRKEIRKGKYKFSRDVGKLVALKHILDNNEQGIMVHGRNLQSPPPAKSQYFTEIKKLNKNKVKSQLKGSYSNATLTKFDEFEEEEENWSPSNKNKKLLKTLTNQFDCSPTRERMTKFKITKGGFVDNYAIKDKFINTCMNPFMSIDFSQFTKPIEIPKSPPEAVIDPAKTKDKEKKKEEVLPNDDQNKKLKENNVLFEKDQDETSLSEVQDPLIQDNRKSQQFLSTKLKQFEIDSKRFSIEGHKKHKERPSLKDKFTNVPMKDPGDHWRSDKYWIEKCNPFYQKSESIKDKKDLRMLQKRHNAHKLKNIALQQDIKVMDKKIIKELSENLF